MGRNWPSGQRTSLTALVRGRSVAAAAALACAPVLSSAKSKDACQALLVPRVARHQGQVGGRPPGQAAGDGSCVQARPPGVRPPVSALKLWGRCSLQGNHVSLLQLAEQAELQAGAGARR